MRVAVISDIHANLAALEATLAEIDDGGPDELWCLGDLVGYGPHPNEVVERVRERADVVLAGNHDLAVLGTIDLGLF
jgi:predicted phosphodiesterase